MNVIGWGQRRTGTRASSAPAVLAAALMLAGVVGMATVAGGCRATPQQVEADHITLYNRGEFGEAYRVAAAAAHRGSTAERAEAAYVAGLAAERRGDLHGAVRFHRRAAELGDRELAADANASLGLVLRLLEQYDESAARLNAAAAELTGEDRARAYFHAGLSLQKLSRWPQARTALLLARDATRDPALRRQIEQQLAVTGYAVQVGAFGDADNAQRAARELAQRPEAARLGPPRLVTARDGSGGTLTLVHVGRFSSFQAAQAARDAVGGEAIVVPLTGE